jgi:hypothetical protein
MERGGQFAAGGRTQRAGKSLASEARKMSESLMRGANQAGSDTKKFFKRMSDAIEESADDAKD